MVVDRRYLRTPSGLIHLRETGDGPLLVLAHGNPWSGEFWDGTLPAFARAGYRVVAFDALGHGLSDRPAAPGSIERQAQSLAEIVERLDGPPIGIVGWHQGSVVALQLGLVRPDLCPALVFDGAGTHDDASARAIVAAVIAHNPACSREDDPGRWWMDFVLGRLTLFNPHFRLSAATWPVYQRLLFGMLQLDPAVSRAPSPMVPPAARPPGASPIDMPYYDWLARLSEFRQPLMLLSSDDEPLRPAHDAACAAAPAARQLVFRGGHPLIGVGREQEYVTPIAAFLASLDQIGTVTAS